MKKILLLLSIATPMLNAADPSAPALTAIQWRFTTPTLANRRSTLESICANLSDVQGQVASQSSQQAENVKSLLAKWLSEAQQHSATIAQQSQYSDQKLNLTQPTKFISAYQRQENEISIAVANLAARMEHNDNPEAGLAELMNGLSVNGQVRADNSAPIGEIIGALANMAME